MKTIYVFLILLLGISTKNNAQQGAALSFDGTNDYVTVANNTTLNVSEFTIETWFKWNGSAAPVEFLTSKGLESFEIHITNANNSIRFIPVPNLYLDTPANSITPNVWTHIACVYKPATATAKIYINGVDMPFTISGTNTTSQPISATTDNFFIGQRSNFVYPFQGSLDEFRFWNKALTQTEVQNRMNCEIPNSETGLLVNFHCNQGLENGTNATQTTLIDTSENGNYGTLSNFALTGTNSNFVGNPPFVSGTVCAGQVYFVNRNVVASGNGLSWATAFKTLQEALEVANIKEIWMAQGRYVPTKDHLGNATPLNNRTKTFILPNNVKIYGGFNATETSRNQRNFTTNITTISGDFVNNDVLTGIGNNISITNNDENVYHVIMSINNSVNTLIDGVTISGGNGGLGGTTTILGVSVEDPSGGGIYIENGSPKFENVIFTKNRSGGGVGGSVRAKNSNSTFKNCNFEYSIAVYGGAFFNENSGIILNNCLFLGNKATASGGGLFNNLGSATTINNTNFSLNAAVTGGGAHNATNSNSTYTNCIFTSNYTSDLYTGGAAMYNGSGSVVTVNASSFNNNSSVRGAGIYNFNTTLNVNDCLFNGNSTYRNFTVGNSSPAGAAIFGTGSTLNIVNSIFQYSSGQASSGLAIYLEGSTSLFTKCNINNNSGNGGIFAVKYDSGTTTFRECVFENNPIGGVWTDGGASSFTNCIFTGNNNFSIYARALTYVTNCTIVGNNSSSPILSSNNYGNLIIKNSIITNNASGVAVDVQSSLSISYSNIAGGFAGVGNIDANNNFANLSNPKGTDGIWFTADDGFQLGCNSGAYNSGNSTDAPTVDVLNVSRPQFGTIDMGAYESAVNLTSAVAPPVAATVQTFCLGATVAQLQATGTNIKWYNGPGTNAQLLTNETVLIFGANYYCSQTIANCESSRTQIVVNLLVTEAPTVTATQSFCSGATVSNLIPNNAVIKWYATPTGGTALNNSSLLTSGNYYASLTENGCESVTRSLVSVIVNTTANPIVSNAQSFCGASTVANLVATGTTIKWYDNLTSVTPLANTTVLATQNYYVTQTLAGCESIKFEVSVLISSPQTKFVDASVTNSGNGLTWAAAYKTIQEAINATCNNGEIWVKSGTYFPTMYPEGCQNCNSDRDFSIYLKNNVKVYAGFAGNETLLSQRNVGQNQTILSGDIGQPNIHTDNVYNVVTSISDSNATQIDGFIIQRGRANVNNNLKIIETQNVSRATGGGMLTIDSNVVVANCVFANNYAEIGGGMYNFLSSIKANNLVFVENGSIYGGGIFNGTNSTCNFQNITLVNNSASVIGGGIFNQYNANITLNNSIVWGSYNTNIFNDSATPIITNCIILDGYAGTGNINADPKFINSINLIGADGKWMTADDGLQISQCSPAVDVGINNANTPNTDIIGNIRFDVTNTGTTNLDLGAYENQTQQNDAPIANATQSFCGSQTIANLTATGVNLKWYLSATGGNALATSTILTNNTYYVSQTINGCESSRTSVTVTINITSLPQVFTNQIICDSGTIANLAAGGNLIKWYANATGGNVLDPATVLTNNTTYYVSQTIYDCESARTAVTVTINPIPAAPSVPAIQTFCGTATVDNLAAIGSNIKWYDNPSSTTPLANTTALNIQTYYATQTVGGCESLRTAVSVLFSTSQINFVNSEVTASGNGLTWATAYKTIQEAINATCGGEIWVKSGTYFPTAYPVGCTNCNSERDYSIHLKNNVKIYGGFAGNETLLSQRNVGQNQTILSGDIGVLNNNTDNVYNVVTSISDSNATQIDGFVIQRGRANVNNNLKIIESVNVSRATGGGMLTINSNVVVANCVFANNFAEIGGGMYNYISSIKANNLLFVENSSIYGGGIFNGTDSLSNFQNITLFNNSASGIGGGIFNQYNANIILNNSIVWGSFNTNIFNDSATPTVTYCNVEGGYAGTGNINVNPKFINTTNIIGADSKWMTADDGLQISQCSAGIDVGINNSNTPNTDIIGNIRFDVANTGTTNLDLGAYENQTQQTATPNANSPQNYSTGATLAALTATGQNIQWFANFESFTALPLSTVITESSYYVSQTINGCESERVEVVVTALLGNQENNFNSKMLVYPNPFIDEISIQIDSAATIEIVDVMGKKLISQKIESGLSKINSNNLPSGMYLARITNQENQTKTIKIIKK